MNEEQEPALVRARQRGIEWRKARNELRDRFAMAALTGLLAEGIDEISHTRAYYADEAYLFADAMLKARDENRQ